MTFALEAGPDGVVVASVDGIRRIVDMPLASVKEHIATLESADEHSKDIGRGGDGRRLERVPNGWRVVNMEWYRDEARRQAELFRKRKWWNEKGDAARRDARPTETETETETERYTETERDPESESLSKAAEPAPDALAVVRRVFDKWRAVHNHPTSKLDAKRTARIRNALKLHTPEQLEQALSGALKDDWIMGRDPKSPRKYDGIETILRDAAQVERLIDLDSGKTKPNAIIGRNAKLHQPNHGKTGWEQDT